MRLLIICLILFYSSVIFSQNFWGPFGLQGKNVEDDGSMPEVFFSDVSQLNDPQYDDYVNLTRFYYENSQANFIMLGDAFTYPDPNSPTYGKAIRINIDPTGANHWGCSKQKSPRKKLNYENPKNIFYKFGNYKVAFAG